MTKYLACALTAGAFIGLSCPDVAQAQTCSNPLVQAIVAEHNAIRTSPAAYAAQLEINRQALIDSRTKGVSNPDPLAEATQAIDTAITDLKQLTPLPPLVCQEGGSKYAAEMAATMNGRHSDITKMTPGWKGKDPAFTGRATAESVTSVPSTGTTDAAKAKAIVQGLFIDWGTGNAGKFMHRCFIIDYNSPSTTPAIRQYKKSFKTIGVGVGTRPVYIQYGW